jgi:hypothetical protein
MDFQENFLLFLLSYRALSGLPPAPVKKYCATIFSL